MSQITEYLKLLPRAIPNADKILKSIITEVQYRNGKLSEDKKAELIRRRVICAGCPYMSTNAKTSDEYFLVTGENYKSSRKEEHCSFCGCGLNKRTASFDSNCGIESWNKENPEKQLSLKWTKFNTDGKDKQNTESAPGVSN